MFGRKLTMLGSLAILMGWLAPSVAALGVGIHLASEHHDPLSTEHEWQLTDLVRAATHGHHHELGTASDHNHDARFDGRVTTFRSDHTFVAVCPAGPSVSAALTECSAVDRSRRRGPPTPLFTTHCSLLI